MLDSLLVTLMLLGAASSSGELPFWAVSNSNGVMPQYNGGVACLNAEMPFDSESELQWRAGLTFAGSLEAAKSPGDPSSITPRAVWNLDQFYGGMRWKNLTLDAGIRHRDLDFLAADPLLGSVSSTGGNLIWSGNSRSLPGASLTLSPLEVPFTRGHFLIYGRYGDYATLDERYVSRALVHNMQLGLMLRFGRFDFSLSLDHYAVWGGESPDFGKMPLTFDNYFRIATGRSASAASGSTESDRINVLGDHRGAECFRFRWRGDGWRITFQHDIPYDDGSGMGFGNWPDGINTLHFGFDNRDRWVTDVLYEFGYTLWQSGTRHEGKDPVTGEHKILGGLDNYFNNQDYRSGWTFYGRTAGMPFMFPAGTRDGSWQQGLLTLGVENNRLVAHHFGLSGKLWRRAPYKLMLTYSRNYGTYRNPYEGESQIYKDWGTVKETPVNQFSAAFTGLVPEIAAGGRLSLQYGLYFDRGGVLRNCFGALLGIGIKIY